MNLCCFFQKEILGSKEKTVQHPKKCNTSKQSLISPFSAIVLMWSGWSSSLLLCKTVYDSVNFQAITKHEFPKYPVEQNCTYPTDLLKTEINQKLFAKADSRVDKLSPSHRIKLSTSYTFLLDGKESGFPMSVFPQHLQCRNADVSDIDLNLVDAADPSPTLLLNQSTEPKERGSWIPFKQWTTQAAKILHSEWWSLLWVCAHFSES